LCFGQLQKKFGKTGRINTKAASGLIPNLAIKNMDRASTFALTSAFPASTIHPQDLNEFDLEYLDVGSESLSFKTGSGKNVLKVPHTQYNEDFNSEIYSQESLKKKAQRSNNANKIFEDLKVPLFSPKTKAVKIKNKPALLQKFVKGKTLEEYGPLYRRSTTNKVVSDLDDALSYEKMDASAKKLEIPKFIFDSGSSRNFIVPEEHHEAFKELAPTITDGTDTVKLLNSKGIKLAAIDLASGYVPNLSEDTHGFSTPVEKWMRMFGFNPYQRLDFKGQHPFPESKVKKVVYHGTARDFDKFAFTKPPVFNWKKFGGDNLYSQSHGVAVVKDEKEVSIASINRPDFNKLKFKDIESARNYVEENTAHTQIVNRPAFYFAENPRYANNFARDFVNETREGGRIIPAHINVKNPLDFRTKEARSFIYKTIKQNKNKIEAEIDMDVNPRAALLNYSRGSWGVPEASHTITDAIKTAGYDAYNTEEGGAFQTYGQDEDDYYQHGGLDKSINWGVFKPEQIKPVFAADGITPNPIDAKTPYIVWDTQTGEAKYKTTYKNRNRARRFAEKKDIEYGAVKHQMGTGASYAAFKLGREKMAKGHVPNLASIKTFSRPLFKGDVKTPMTLSVEKDDKAKTKNFSLKTQNDSFLTFYKDYADPEEKNNLYLEWSKSKQKGDGTKLYSKFFDIAKKKRAKVISRNFVAQDYDIPVTSETVYKRFPQLKIREKLGLDDTKFNFVFDENRKEKPFESITTFKKFLKDHPKGWKDGFIHNIINDFSTEDSEKQNEYAMGEVPNLALGYGKFKSNFLGLKDIVRDPKGTIKRLPFRIAGSVGAFGAGLVTEKVLGNKLEAQQFYSASRYLSGIGGVRTLSLNDKEIASSISEKNLLVSRGENRPGEVFTAREPLLNTIGSYRIGFNKKRGAIIQDAFDFDNSVSSARELGTEKDESKTFSQIFELNKFPKKSQKIINKIFDKFGKDEVISFARRKKISFGPVSFIKFLYDNYSQIEATGNDLDFAPYGSPFLTRIPIGKKIEKTKSPESFAYGYMPESYNEGEVPNLAISLSTAKKFVGAAKVRGVQFLKNSDKNAFEKQGAFVANPNAPYGFDLEDAVHVVKNSPIEAVLHEIGHSISTKGKTQYAREIEANENVLERLQGQEKEDYRATANQQLKSYKQGFLLRKFADNADKIGFNYPAFRDQFGGRPMSSDLLFAVRDKIGKEKYLQIIKESKSPFLQKKFAQGKVPNLAISLSTAKKFVKGAKDSGVQFVKGDKNFYEKSILSANPVISTQKNAPIKTVLHEIGHSLSDTFFFGDRFEEEVKANQNIIDRLSGPEEKEYRAFANKQMKSYKQGELVRRFKINSDKTGLNWGALVAEFKGKPITSEVLRSIKNKVGKENYIQTIRNIDTPILQQRFAAGKIPNLAKKPIVYTQKHLDTAKEMHNAVFNDFSSISQVMASRYGRAKNGGLNIKNFSEEDKKQYNYLYRKADRFFNYYQEVKNALERENNATGGMATLSQSNKLITTENPMGFAAIDKSSQRSADDAITQHTVIGQTINDIKHARTSAKGFVPNLASDDSSQVMISALLAASQGLSDLGSVGSTFKDLKNSMFSVIGVFGKTAQQQSQYISSMAKSIQVQKDWVSSVTQAKNDILVGKKTSVSLPTVPGGSATQNFTSYNSIRTAFDNKLEATTKTIDEYDKAVRSQRKGIQTLGLVASIGGGVVGGFASQLASKVSPDLAAGIDDFTSGVQTGGQILTVFQGTVGKTLAGFSILAGALEGIDTYSKGIEGAKKQFDIQQGQSQKLAAGFDSLAQSLNSLDNLILDASVSVDVLTKEQRRYEETLARVSTISPRGKEIAEDIRNTPDTQSKIRKLGQAKEEEGKKVETAAGLLQIKELAASRGSALLPILTGGVAKRTSLSGGIFGFKTEAEQKASSQVLQNNAFNAVSNLGDTVKQSFIEAVGDKQTFTKLAESTESTRNVISQIKDTGGKQSDIDLFVEQLRLIVGNEAINKNPKVIATRKEALAKNEEAQFSVENATRNETAFRRLLLNSASLQGGNILDIRKIGIRGQSNTAAVNEAGERARSGAFNVLFGEETSQIRELNINTNKIKSDREEKISNLGNQTSRNLLNVFTQGFDTFIKKTDTGDSGAGLNTKDLPKISEFRQQGLEALTKGLTAVVREGDLTRFQGQNGQLDFKGLEDAILARGGGSESINRNLQEFLTSNRGSEEILKIISQNNNDLVEVNQDALRELQIQNQKLEAIRKEANVRRQSTFLGGTRALTDRDFRRQTTRQFIRGSRLLETGRTVETRARGADILLSQIKELGLNPLTVAGPPDEKTGKFTGVKGNQLSEKVAQALNVEVEGLDNVFSKMESRINKSLNRPNQQKSQFPGLSKALITAQFDSSLRSGAAGVSVASKFRPEGGDVISEATNNLSSNTDIVTQSFEKASQSVEGFAESLTGLRQKLDDAIKGLASSRENQKTVQETGRANVTAANKEAFKNANFATSQAQLDTTQEQTSKSSNFGALIPKILTVGLIAAGTLLHPRGRGLLKEYVTGNKGLLTKFGKSGTIPDKQLKGPLTARPLTAKETQITNVAKEFSSTVSEAQKKSVQSWEQIVAKNNAGAIGKVKGAKPPKAAKVPPSISNVPVSIEIAKALNTPKYEGTIAEATKTAETVKTTTKKPSKAKTSSVSEKGSGVKIPETLKGSGIKVPASAKGGGIKIPASLTGGGIKIPKHVSKLGKVGLAVALLSAFSSANAEASGQETVDENGRPQPPKPKNYADIGIGVIKHAALPVASILSSEFLGHQGGTLGKIANVGSKSIGVGKQVGAGIALDVAGLALDAFVPTNYKKENNVFQKSQDKIENVLDYASYVPIPAVGLSSLRPNLVLRREIDSMIKTLAG
jgi:hypothetical protein